MIIDELYTFEKIGDKKTRIDCISSTQGYEPFESMRNKQGNLFIYLGSSNHTKAGKNHKADLAISKKNHISSIYILDVESNLGFGDMINTEDALLFILYDVKVVNNIVQQGSKIDVLVAKGQSKNRQNLYTLLEDGELDEQIETLRNRERKLNAI